MKTAIELLEQQCRDLEERREACLGENSRLKGELDKARAEAAEWQQKFTNLVNGLQHG